MSWLTGWSRRKSKTINGSTGGAQSNYQMLTIRVHKDTDSDTASGDNGSIQHVYVGTSVRDDFGDVRFTKADGSTLLDYFMQHLASGSYADFVVEVDSIPEDPATVDIYVYYDKSDATTTSSGGDTFPTFFDDFPGASIDLGKWDGDTGSASVAESIVTFGGDSKVMESIADFSDPCSLLAKRRMSTGNWIQFGIGSGNIARNCFVNLVTTTIWERAGDANSYADVSTNWTPGQYKIIRQTWKSDKLSWFEEGSERTNSPYTTVANIPTIDIPIHFSTDKIANLIYADWVAIGKYVDPEPTWGAFGGEETLLVGGILAQIF